jgi:glutathione synthase/RimK-type ligase-like ATP-grasp enzyme
MKIGLLLNSDNRLFPNYSEKFRELLDKNAITYTLINPNSQTMLDDLASCTHLLFRHSQGDTDMMLYDSIFHIAKNIYNLKCSPDYETYWSYENKIKEYYLLKSSGFPVVETNIFWDYNSAYKFLQTSSYPLVVKMYKGAASSNVVKISSIGDGKKIIDRIFGKGVKLGKMPGGSNLTSISKLGMSKFIHNKARSLLIAMGILDRSNPYSEWQIQKDAILFQKFLPNNKFDTRVTIIGNRAFAFRRFVRSNDFRASGSGNLNLEPKEIDRRCISIAFDVSRKLNFETMAYDFIYDEKCVPQICEISYCFVDRVLRSCPGYWDDVLTWHDEQNWPQYYQLVDFLNVDSLQPV